MKINKILFFTSYHCFLLLGSWSTIATPPSKPYQIAFVKQVVYQDLYCSNSLNRAELVFSSFRRSGPVALFSALNADFFIVDTEPDPECAIWQEKARAQLGIAYYESLKTTIPPDGLLVGHTHPQGYYAIKCDSINWGIYDIVISMDISIPQRIIKKYPHTLWAYYIGEGFGPSFKHSYREPIANYDTFLTQDYAEKTNYKEHVIEFPYHLQYHGCFHELLGQSSDYPRHGISLEIHTERFLPKEQQDALNEISPISKRLMLKEPLKDLINRLIQTKYFIVFIEPAPGIRSKIRGNSIPEAIAAGNLVIARKRCLKNISLLSEKTVVNSFQELIEQIRYFEQNPEAYAQELKNQREKLNWFCFERPIKELYEHCDRKKALQHK
jgi:hypothetical protein